MTQPTATSDTNVEIVTAKRRIKLPHVNVKKTVVTTLAVVGAVALAKTVKDKLHRGEDNSDDTVVVETSEV